MPFRLVTVHGHSVDHTFDVQLVDDGLAGDQLFTLEQSVPGAEGKKRWCSLRERLDSAEIERVQRFLTRLLSRMTPAEYHWTWFVDRLQFVENSADATQLEKPDAYITIEGRDELLEMGSRLSIFELEPRHLGHYAPLWGRFDSIHGVATTTDFRSLLQEVSIADPIPTTVYSRFSRAANPNGVARMLALGDPFVEEILNGTRLRVVSRRLDEDQMARLVEDAGSP